MSTPNLLDDLQPFYLLNYASVDLDSYDHQWYVPDVDRSNIVDAMREEAERFMRP
ncbi:hypothetical protein MalM25_21850 [Planctomycetes bacterium MalM25]|nr:hypothetical protein MalM25_21850 [Planctomycetes bacterium MalM25]